MPSVGPLEIAIVVLIALIVFGPKRMPELGRSAGAGLRELKSSLGGPGRDRPTVQPVRVEAESDGEHAKADSGPAGSKTDA